MYNRKLKQLQQAQTIVTNTIICTNCGGAGHLGKDCKQQRPGDTYRNMLQQESASDKAKMDSEVRVHVGKHSHLGGGGIFGLPWATNSMAPGYFTENRTDFEITCKFNLEYT